MDDFSDLNRRLETPDMPGHIRARKNIVSQYLESRGVKVVNLQVENGRGLIKIFLWIQYVDFVIYYLALINCVDPTPVKAIDYLKGKLSKTD